MLTSLHIENYALIGKIKIDFDDGFNVLTGETGAGKSIIIGALSLVLGERASSDIIKTGEEKAYVEAVFDVSKNDKIKKVLKEFGIEEKTIILSREVLSQGKTQARVNGRAVTQAFLRDISKHLIDIHGQHEHQSLLNSENHIDLLDNLGNKDMLSLKEKVKEDYLKLQDLKLKLKNLLESKEERESKIDYLKFRIKEIDDASLKEGEEERLKEERDILSNSSKLIERANEIHSLIFGEGEGRGSLDALKMASKKLLEMANVDKKLKKLSDRLESLSIELKDIASEILSYQDKIIFDPKRLEEIEDRLYLISELKRKYGNSIRDILKKKDEEEKELMFLEKSTEALQDVEKEIDFISKSLGEKCEKLSNLRQELAKKIELDVKRELEELNMPKVKFKVDFRFEEDEDGIPFKGKRLKVFSKGFDQIEFLISPNPGEPLKPLSKIASGGEISRIMLALKCIMNRADEIDTMVFDEIDVGIGGQTAQMVGKKLSMLSKLKQIICITHLPQIASKPGKHIHVRKVVESGRTNVYIKELSKEERVKEIANLLSGKITETSLKTARELVENPL